MSLTKWHSATVRWLVVLFLCIQVPLVWAAVPTTVNYSGTLSDNSGNPLSGPHSVTFNLYSVPSGGSPLWTETHSVNAADGLLSVMLGANTPFPVAIFEDPVYLGITIETDQEMTPRLAIASVPSALVADSTVSCTHPQINCYGTCADIDTDPNNCGGCGSACNTGAGETCASGNCTADADGDGANRPEAGGNDCDDSNNMVYPGADEYCNGIDDDCDGEIDEADAVDAQTWYQDSDGDAYGNPGAQIFGCQPGNDYVMDSSDCDDSDPHTNPGASEICDFVDNDCDGQTDEDGVCGPL